VLEVWTCIPISMEKFPSSRKRYNYVDFQPAYLGASIVAVNPARRAKLPECVERPHNIYRRAWGFGHRTKNTGRRGALENTPAHPSGMPINITPH